MDCAPQIACQVRTGKTGKSLRKSKDLVAKLVFPLRLISPEGINSFATNQSKAKAIKLKSNENSVYYVEGSDRSNSYP